LLQAGDLVVLSLHFILEFSVQPLNGRQRDAIIENLREDVDQQIEVAVA
jgi:hypothetical protein